MDKENEGQKNQELTEQPKKSRRDFLRNSSKKALGGAAAAYFGLAMSKDGAQNAHAEEGCFCYCWWCGGCSGSCDSTCDGCSSCSGGCHDSCTSDCSTRSMPDWVKLNNGQQTIAPDLHRSDLIQDVFMA